MSEERVGERKLRVELEAEEELAAAVRWYDAQQSGLGADLLAAIDETITKVRETPEAFGLVPDAPADIPARQVRVRRFPYRVVFLASKDGVHVLAFAHERRRPGYWRHRA